MSKVFISYRRDDSAGYAHAIHSRLVQHFSKDQVFIDVDAVEPGVDFVRAIEKAVGECDVLVALIGKRWVGGEPGKVFRDQLKSGEGEPEMDVVSAGSFRMGDVQRGRNADQVPVRTVRFQKPFAIGGYEVTFEEYDRFAKVTGRPLPGEKKLGQRSPAGDQCLVARCCGICQVAVCTNWQALPFTDRG